MKLELSRNDVQRILGRKQMVDLAKLLFGCGSMFRVAVRETASSEDKDQGYSFMPASDFVEPGQIYCL